MLPFKSLLVFDRQRPTPLYLQLCNELIKSISKGHLQAGQKLPGSRKMAQLLSVNRRTIITAYEELEAQGWLDIKPNKGCFVNDKLPFTQPQKLQSQDDIDDLELGFERNEKLDFLSYHIPVPKANVRHLIDAGYPDVRLAPLRELTTQFNGVLRSKQLSKLLNYSSSFEGDIMLRQQVIEYLVNTRSINAKLENLIITRGSLMAFSNIFQILLQRGDHVIVGKPAFHVANDIIRIAGGNLIEIEVDELGICVDSIEAECKKQTIRAVFIMPHHHNPTPVTLCAERRMRLLQLAKEYRFAIIEDDYDYDFHYDNSPILPLASSDQSNSVIYVGSFSKTVAPGLRMGFVVAPSHFVKDMTRLSRFIDSHGNMLLERTMALLFENGEIRRHMKKSVKEYRKRRDLFCELLTSELGDIIDFHIPEGGLAAWVKFDSSLPITEIREKALAKGLQIPKPNYFDLNGTHLNAIRMGFASLNEEEMEGAFKILGELI